jgi:hypothetical protein
MQKRATGQSSTQRFFLLLCLGKNRFPRTDRIRKLLLPTLPEHLPVSRRGKIRDSGFLEFYNQDSEAVGLHDILFHIKQNNKEPWKDSTIRSWQFIFFKAEIIKL